VAVKVWTSAKATVGGTRAARRIMTNRAGMVAQYGWGAMRGSRRRGSMGWSLRAIAKNLGVSTESVALE